MIRAATRAVGVSPTVTSRTKPRFSTPSGPSPPTNSSPSSAIPSKRRRAPSWTMMMAAGFTYFHHALEEPHFFMCMMAASSFDIPAGFVAAAEEPGEDPRVQAIFNFYGYMAQYARSIGQEPNRQHMMQNCLASRMVHDARFHSLVPQRSFWVTAGGKGGNYGAGGYCLRCSRLGLRSPSGGPPPTAKN